MQKQTTMLLLRAVEYKDFTHVGTSTQNTTKFSTQSKIIDANVQKNGGTYEFLGYVQ